VNGAPSPSRYSLVSLDGSALVVPGLYLAYRGIDKLRIGAGVQLLTGSFQSSVVFSASPADRVIAAPEDPTYDALSRLSVGPILAPSANAGLIYELAPWMRVGLSGQLPFWVNSPARVRVRLPNAAPFDNARQEGEDARVRFRLPGAVRLGVEFRPTDTLRVEVGFAREFWGIHDEIEIRPQNIQLTGITGFPSPFGVAPISIPRGFRASNSYRIGGEYRFEVAGYRFDARAGVSYEESAIPRAYLSPLTIDLDKVTVSLGGSLHVGGHWRFDAVYARVFGMGETVSPAEAAVPRVNPVRGNPTQTEAVNGGTYAARADVIGVGLAYRF
jgi:long-chain fatty acid transport protein